MKIFKNIWKKFKNYWANKMYMNKIRTSISICFLKNLNVFNI